MEVKVKPEESIDSTVIGNKEEDETKKMEETVVIGRKAGEEISKGKETMKIVERLRQNQDDSKNESLEMKFQNDKTWSQNAENTKKEEEKNHKKTSSHVWDCGSTLYDSFELNSFKRQLDSAISASSARTMSMSHLPDRRLPSSSPPPPPATSSSSSGGKKHSNKISRSLQRFLKSVFRTKQHQNSPSSTPSSPVYKAAPHGDRYYVVYDKSGSLTTIPESTEKEVGPEINSLVRKTVSERFPASRVVGISCA